MRNKITILAFILAGEHPILQLIKTNLEVYNRVIIFPPFLAPTIINLFDN